MATEIIVPKIGFAMTEGDLTEWLVGDGQPVFGSCKGMLNVVSEDDEHLKDFAEYMP